MKEMTLSKEKLDLDKLTAEKGWIYGVFQYLSGEIHWSSLKKDAAEPGMYLLRIEDGWNEEYDKFGKRIRDKEFNISDGPHASDLVSFTPLHPYDTEYRAKMDWLKSNYVFANYQGAKEGALERN